jgi:hypothetical protein
VTGLAVVNDIWLPDGTVLRGGDAIGYHAERDLRATLAACAADPSVRWRELAGLGNGGAGAYWQEWHCEPPPPGQGFWVTSQDWVTDKGGLPVRRIYEIELAHARTGNNRSDRRDADRDGPSRSGPAAAAGIPWPCPDAAAPGVTAPEGAG